MKTISLITITISGKTVSESRNLVTNEGVKAILAGNFASHRFRLMLTQQNPSVLDADELPEAVATFTPSRTVTAERDDIDKTYARVRVRYSHSFTAASEIAFNALALTTTTGVAHTHARLTDMLGRPALITVLEGEQITITYDVVLNVGYDLPVNIQLGSSFYQAKRNVNPSSAIVDFRPLALYHEGAKVKDLSVSALFIPATRSSQSTMSVLSIGETGTLVFDRITFGPLEYTLTEPAELTADRLTLTISLGWN